MDKEVVAALPQDRMVKPLSEHILSPGFMRFLRFSSVDTAAFPEPEDDRNYGRVLPPIADSGQVLVRAIGCLSVALLVIAAVFAVAFPQSNDGPTSAAMPTGDSKSAAIERSLVGAAPVTRSPNALNPSTAFNPAGIEQWSETGKVIVDGGSPDYAEPMPPPGRAWGGKLVEYRVVTMRGERVVFLGSLVRNRDIGAMDQVWLAIARRDATGSLKIQSVDFSKSDLRVPATYLPVNLPSVAYVDVAEAARAAFNR